MLSSHFLLSRHIHHKYIPFTFFSDSSSICGLRTIYNSYKFDMNSNIFIQHDHIVIHQHQKFCQVIHALPCISSFNSYAEKGRKNISSFQGIWKTLIGSVQPQFCYLVFQTQTILRKTLNRLKDLKAFPFMILFPFWRF